MEERGPSAYLAEFIGTLLLVMFIVFVIFGRGQVFAGTPDILAIGMVHFLVLAVLVLSLGGVSGGHFNPAVTVTLLALRKISPRDAGVYIVVQVLGAIAAALIVKAVLQGEGDFNYGAPTLDGVNGKAFAGFLAEGIGAFVLLFAIVATAVYGRGNASNWAPWGIGAALGLAVIALGQLTGASLNPARALGPAIVGDFGTGAGKWILAYVLGPVVGGLSAGLVYRAMFGEQQVGAAEPEPGTR
jgi:MIP family channel proteins